PVGRTTRRDPELRRGSEPPPAQWQYFLSRASGRCIRQASSAVRSRRAERPRRMLRPTQSAPVDHACRVLSASSIVLPFHPPCFAARPHIAHRQLVITERALLRLRARSARSISPFSAMSLRARSCALSLRRAQCLQSRLQQFFKTRRARCPLAFRYRAFCLSPVISQVRQRGNHVSFYTCLRRWHFFLGHRHRFQLVF